MNRFLAVILIMLSAVCFASDPSDAVLQRLARVERFAFGGTGYAGMRSKGEADFNRILALSPSAALVAFENLYATGNTQAKCYALAGIRKLKPNRFKELLDSVRDSQDEVVTMRGCIISHEPLGQVAKQIAGGKFHVRAARG